MVSGRSLGEDLTTRFLARLKVRIDSCVTYNFYASVKPGDEVGFVEIRNAGGTLIHIEAGDSSIAGRLGPGVYTFEGWSRVFPPGNFPPFTQGATYSMIWTCSQCSSSLIAGQPGDLLVACNSTATFCVSPSAPVGSLTFQWRKNGVPLVNSAHVSGATTPCLSIHNACHADTGYYDVVVSNGSIVEPSRLAHLGIATTTSVDLMPMRSFSLGAAAPNPFAASTSCRYDAPRPFRANVAIFDATGRMVRHIADRVLSGTGTLTWDGKVTSGSMAAPGVYFLRVGEGALAQVRRIALVR